MLIETEKITIDTIKDLKVWDIINDDGVKNKVKEIGYPNILVWPHYVEAPYIKRYNPNLEIIKISPFGNNLLKFKYEEKDTFVFEYHFNNGNTIIKKLWRPFVIWIDSKWKSIQWYLNDITDIRGVWKIYQSKKNYQVISQNKDSITLK